VRALEADDDSYAVLNESPESVAELLKSAAHHGRVRVLTLLLKGEQDLSTLVDETGLSKNALVNHLTMLIENGLVERVDRGEYVITHDGRDLIKAAASIYQESTLRREEMRRRSKRLYTGGWSGDSMSETMVDREVEYQPCWISYTGAIAGTMRSLGVDCDVVDVGGHSGYAFIVNTIKGEFCPSGPTAMHPDTWEEMHWGAQDLGWRMVHWLDFGSYPREEGTLKPEEIERAQKLFDLVKVEIEQDMPVVLWGLYIPEYGIVKGIKGNSYVASSYRSLSGLPEEPQPFFELKAPGCLDAYFFREKIDVDSAEADRKAVERGLRFARGQMPVSERYVHGPEAWTEWAEVLENHPEQNLYHGNSYTAACWHEARSMAAEFLNRMADRNKGPHVKHLSEASKIYVEIAMLLSEFTEIFPFKMEGEMTAEARKKGAKILRKARPLDEKAAAQLEKALESWKTP
jgi:DNA-binding HxlR family transcriptional regulator